MGAAAASQLWALPPDKNPKSVENNTNNNNNEHPCGHLSALPPAPGRLPSPRVVLPRIFLLAPSHGGLFPPPRVQPAAVCCPGRRRGRRQHPRLRLSSPALHRKEGSLHPARGCCGRGGPSGARSPHPQAAYPPAAREEEEEDEEEGRVFCRPFAAFPRPPPSPDRRAIKGFCKSVRIPFTWGPPLPAVLPFRCLFLFLFYNCCINIMLPFFLCLYRYRYTRQTKGFGRYSAPPHLSRSPNSGALSLLAAFPCFWSSSYGRSRWLLIG